MVWEFKIKFGINGKYIFSSPALSGKLVIFGAYDGNVYALDKASGRKVWRYDAADWIGSSPAISHDLNLVFIGLEFGLIGRRGGVAALDLKTGQQCWVQQSRDYTHGTPIYVKKTGIVYCGSNDGTVTAYRAKDGIVIWRYKAGAEVKASLAYDATSGILAFGAFDGGIYILDAKTGLPKGIYFTDAGIYSTPVIWGDLVIAGSLDKYLYAVGTNDNALKWKTFLGGRIFASPVIAGNLLFIGSNSGRLFVIDPSTGNVIDFFQATERIVNKAIIEGCGRKIYFSTDANELYCILSGQQLH
jgi:eukaryotic-like serine/threonine-protein kinase